MLRLDTSKKTTVWEIDSSFICLKLMYKTISIFRELNYLGALDIQNKLAKKTCSPETSLLLQRQVTNNPVTALVIVSGIIKHNIPIPVTAVHFRFFKLKFSKDVCSLFFMIQDGRQIEHVLFVVQIISI